MTTGDPRKDFFTELACILEEDIMFYEAGWHEHLSLYVDFSIFKELFLKRTDFYSHWIYCPLRKTCDRNCPLSIEKEGSKYYGVCSQNKISRQWVDTGAVRNEEFNLERFHCKLAEALPVEPSVEQTSGKTTWLLGTLRHEPIAHRRVYITYENSFDLAKEVTRLSLLDTRPVIMLTLCRLNLSNDDDFIIAGMKAVRLAINDILVIDHNCNFSLHPDMPVSIKELFSHSAKKRTKAFSAPSGIQWPDIRLRFLDAHTLSCRIIQSNYTFSFQDLKMTNGRTGKPDKNWLYLLKLAEMQGNHKVNWLNSASALREQQRKRCLAKALQAFFNIEAEPIIYDRQTFSYICQFSLKAETDSTVYRTSRKK